MQDKTIANAARAIMEGQTDSNLWMDAFDRLNKQLTEMNRLSSAVTDLNKVAEDIVDHAWALKRENPEAEMVPEEARQLFKNAERVSQLLTTSMSKVNRRLKHIEQLLDAGTRELQDVMLSHK